MGCERREKLDPVQEAPFDRSSRLQRSLDLAHAHLKVAGAASATAVAGHYLVTAGGGRTDRCAHGRAACRRAAASEHAGLPCRRKGGAPGGLATWAG
eukprot:5597188-Prymnesium_polylepis.1